jgi:hypothetical protein
MVEGRRVFRVLLSGLLGDWAAVSFPKVCDTTTTRNSSASMHHFSLYQLFIFTHSQTAPVYNVLISTSCISASRPEVRYRTAPLQHK